MINFRDFRQSNLSESVVKTYRIGKYKASVNKDGSKFVAYLDGDKFDTFNSVKEAEKAMKDFVDLLASDNQK